MYIIQLLQQIYRKHVLEHVDRAGHSGLGCYGLMGLYVLLNCQGHMRTGPTDYSGIRTTRLNGQL